MEELKWAPWWKDRLSRSTFLRPAAAAPAPASPPASARKERAGGCGGVAVGLGTRGSGCEKAGDAAGGWSPELRCRAFCSRPYYLGFPKRSSQMLCATAHTPQQPSTHPPQNHNAHSRLRPAPVAAAAPPTHIQLKPEDTRQTTSACSCHSPRASCRMPLPLIHPPIYTKKETRKKGPAHLRPAPGAAGAPPRG